MSLPFFLWQAHTPASLLLSSLVRDQIGAYCDANRTRIQDINVGIFRISSSNKIIIMKRRSRSRVRYRVTVALPSNWGSHRKVKWIIASNVENHLPISHSSIFHRVAFLFSTSLSPFSSQRERDDKLYCVLWYQSTREFNLWCLSVTWDYKTIPNPNIRICNCSLIVRRRIILINHNDRWDGYLNQTFKNISNQKSNIWIFMFYMTISVRDLITNISLLISIFY